ncbi:hypothetical protein Mpal_1413 [Methanosphaerula palustris E1-9c]|uniref:Uncharacterized protein n=1 Tax=Methanosphaerula palustris (strain ATCC BAA-1556 / DSM 19958 / E1-9c) TaxID=521011 RepID=B8GI02_METPE|nr:hypothetical protein Mpal_1413 [Methanosphaerula palustris E1-9c]
MNGGVVNIVDRQLHFTFSSDDVESWRATSKAGLILRAVI